jgi:hypothetical protein
MDRDFSSLELSTETIRELTEDELKRANGGAANTTTLLGGDTGTFACPSGATWFKDCDSVRATCG